MLVKQFIFDEKKNNMKDCTKEILINLPLSGHNDRMYVHINIIPSQQAYTSLPQFDWSRTNLEWYLYFDILSRNLELFSLLTF